MLKNNSQKWCYRASVDKLPCKRKKTIVFASEFWFGNIGFFKRVVTK